MSNSLEVDKLIISSEPSRHSVRTLDYKPTRLISEGSIEFKSLPSIPEPKGYIGQSRLRTHCEKLTKRCSCPEILVCDDDPYQHFCYINFFSKSLDSEESRKSALSFQISMSYSGEELINQFKEIKQCGCGKPRLVITDYFMGENSLNGMSTAVSLRQAGFDGSIIVRSSNSLDELSKTESGIKEATSTGIINSCLLKSDIQGLKSILKEFY